MTRSEVDQALFNIGFVAAGYTGDGFLRDLPYYAHPDHDFYATQCDLAADGIEKDLQDRDLVKLFIKSDGLFVETLVSCSILDDKELMVDELNSLQKDWDKIKEERDAS